MKPENWIQGMSMELHEKYIDNKIHNIDCIEGLKQLEDNSVDLCVTSPPYNVDLGNNKYHKNPYDLYNDNKEHG